MKSSYFNSEFFMWKENVKNSKMSFAFVITAKFILEIFYMFFSWSCPADQCGSPGQIIYHMFDTW